MAQGPPTSLPAPFGPEPGRTAGLGQLAHAQNVALALGDGDDAARIQQIKDVACLDTLVIGRQRQPMTPVVGTRSGIAGCQQRLALLFGIAEVLQQDVRIGVLKIEARVFLFGLQEHIAVGQLALIVAAVEVEIKYAIDALDVHRQTFETVGDLARYRIAVETADLLEVGELRHLHAIAPHLPAQSPGAEGWALPIVLDEANVVYLGIDADAREALQI